MSIIIRVVVVVLSAYAGSFVAGIQFRTHLTIMKRRRCPDHKAGAGQLQQAVLRKCERCFLRQGRTFWCSSRNVAGRIALKERLCGNIIRAVP